MSSYPARNPPSFVAPSPPVVELLPVASSSRLSYLAPRLVLAALVLAAFLTLATLLTVAPNLVVPPSDPLRTTPYASSICQSVDASGDSMVKYERCPAEGQVARCCPVNAGWFTEVVCAGDGMTCSMYPIGLRLALRVAVWVVFAVVLLSVCCCLRRQSTELYYQRRTAAHQQTAAAERMYVVVDDGSAYGRLQ